MESNELFLIEQESLKREVRETEAKVLQAMNSKNKDYCSLMESALKEFRMQITDARNISEYYGQKLDIKVKRKVWEELLKYKNSLSQNIAEAALEDNITSKIEGNSGYSRRKPFFNLFGTKLKKAALTTLILAILATGSCTFTNYKSNKNTNHNSQTNETIQQKLVPAQSAEDYRIVIYAPRCEAVLYHKEGTNYVPVRRTAVALGYPQLKTPLKDTYIRCKLEKVTLNDINFNRSGAKKIDLSGVRAMYIHDKDDPREFAFHNFPVRYDRNGNIIPYNLKLGEFASGGCIRMGDNDMREWFDAVKEGTKVSFVYNIVEINTNRMDIVIYKDYYSNIINRTQFAMNELSKASVNTNEIDRGKLSCIIAEAEQNGRCETSIQHIKKNEFIALQ